MPKASTLRDQILSLSIPEPNSGCWLWIGAALPKGYGTLTSKGRTYRASRAAWLTFRGPIAPGLMVCHKCDVTCCVNPDHLFLGTASDNMIDMTRKGRRVAPDKRGILHHSAKLTEADVLAIRAAPGYLKDIAAEYGISISLASLVRRRKLWAHLP